MTISHTLHKFFQGTATYAEEVQVRSWMEASPENRRQFFYERQLFDLKTLSPSLKEGKVVRKTWKKVAITSLKVAALLALIFTTALLTKTFFTQHPDLTAHQTILVPAGQRVQLILPDNTVVWLNSNTKLQYPTVFAKDIRKVQLDGEAYFEVSKNPKRPFLVSTSRGDIRVTGTSFNVDAYANRDVFETALMEGKVEVFVNGQTERVIALNPNHKAIFNNGELQVEEITNYDAYLWRKGLIAFKDKTLKEILFQFEKYFDVKIKLKPDFALEHTYTGKFRQSDGIDYALRVLQKSIRFDYKRDDEKQIIYIK